MKKLYIIGAGSVGGHVALNFHDYSKDFELEGFFDDDPNKIGTSQYGLNVLGPVQDVLALKNVDLVIGIAFSKEKQNIIQRLSVNQSLNYPSMIHEKAWVSTGVKIGQGSIIYHGTSINYGCKVGDFVVMNMNCALGHHTEVGNYSSLAPGVNTGGHTTIEEAVDMGIGASTIQDVTIGSDSIIGGQALIHKDIPPDSKAMGVPVRIK